VDQRQEGATRTTTRHKRADGSRFLQYFGPLLDALRALGGSGTPDEVVEQIATDLKLSDDVQNETVPSGGSRLRTNVAWARFYLVQEGLLDSSERGVWSLTERGRSARLTVAEAGAIFRKWVQVFEERRRNKESSSASVSDLSSENTPGDSELADSIQPRLIDLLVNKLSPAGFERLSQRLLREAGFVQVVVKGRAGDGGIDGHGTLQVSPLVSFKVLFQCKRYAGSVSPSQVRDFRGAMAGRADKGSLSRLEPSRPKRGVKLHETGQCRSSSSTVRSL
jgi:restriction system protein